MKRIALFVFVAVATALFAYQNYPVEAAEALKQGLVAANWLWENIRANPVPVGFSVGTFLLTVAYYKFKGKSLRDALEVAATRVTVVPVSAPAPTADEADVLKRAKARAMRQQLMADRNGLENRKRKLPEELVKAEHEALSTKQAVAEASKKLAERQEAFDRAQAKLQSLRSERAVADAEMQAIDGELKRLAELV